MKQQLTSPLAITIYLFLAFYGLRLLEPGRYHYHRSMVVTVRFNNGVVIVYPPRPGFCYHHLYSGELLIGNIILDAAGIECYSVKESNGYATGQ